MRPVFHSAIVQAAVLALAAASCTSSASNPAYGSGGRQPGGAGAGGAGAVGGSSSTGGAALDGGATGSGGAVRSGGVMGAGGVDGTGGARIVDAGGIAGGRDAGRDASAQGGMTGARGGAGGVTSTAGGRGGTAAAGANGTGGAGGSNGTRPTVTAAAGTKLVKIDPSVRHQTFEGFGTSLCWWASHVGGWSTTARNAVVDAVVDPENGLGYNVFRYNIGGGENPAHSHMDQFRDMPGFQPSSGTWDWNADANQRAILQRIVERGSSVILEAFSNSPPYWMTSSGCASGSSDGSNNLKDGSYDAFADYLTEVVKHYHDAWNITFRTLEPLNEPNANWWKANGTQEGCHFSPSNQQTIIKAVGAKLSAKGLAGTTVSASDENSLDDAYSNIRGFDSATLTVMSQMNVHSYAGTRRAEVRTLATSKGKRLWQSESGPLNQTLADDTEAALFMAGRIITDLRDLEPEAWIDWQVGDPSRNWASLTLDDAKQSFGYLKRFYMHAGFSRYIRPGAVFVDVDNPDMVAAVSADGRSLTLVVRNGDTSASKGFTFDLTALPSVGASAEAHRTSRTENLAALTSIAIADWSFVATAPAYSVTTFVVPLP